MQKERFRWREPKTFLSFHDEFARSKRRWWHGPLQVTIVAAMLLAAWYLAHFNPQKHPPPFSTALQAGVSAGIFAAYIVPWIVSLCPSEVRVSEKFVIRSRANQHQWIKYSEIESFEWRVREEFSTLVLRLRKRGREVFIGVPPEISREAISKFLVEHSVTPGQSA